MTNELSNGSDKFVDYFQENLNLYDEIKRQIEEIKSEPNKVVVFIFQNSKEWEKYEKLYNELNSNENIRCYAVPIPYYIRKTDFMIDEENLYFDGDEIQTDVALEDYESFDFENIDCIIKSSPYDDSYGDVNIPFFHSENLHNCCKTIIHVPTLDIIDFTEESGKMMEMAKCFVKTKSVMYSDYVILNSKVNRKTYIQILSEACDNVEWDKKVLYSTDDEMAEVIIQKCMK